MSERVTLLATDENPAYSYIEQRHPSGHQPRQAANTCAATVHTNNIESVWSLLKRGIVGTYHNVSKDYLPLYLNEFSYRHNNRHSADAFASMVETCGR